MASTVPDTVRFRLSEVRRLMAADGNSETLTCLATDADGAHVCRFRLELILPRPRADQLFAFAKGRFQREPGSDAGAFLAKLVRALGARAPLPATPARVEELPFSVAILGRDQSRGVASDDVRAGGFTSRPRGGWLVTKLFLAEGEGEVFLNLNPAGNIGEFSLKDPDYGDVVVGELARVL